MTQSFFRGLGAIGLAMALAMPAVAQISTRTDNTAYGGTSGEFMLLGAGARGAALGGAYAALATDVTALYYNPGGLAQLPRPGAMVSTYDYVAGTRYSWLGIAYRVPRSEEHTSELQSQSNLVCRLLLEKKKETESVNVVG